MPPLREAPVKISQDILDIYGICWLWNIANIAQLPWHHSFVLILLFGLLLHEFNTCIAWVTVSCIPWVALRGWFIVNPRLAIPKRVIGGRASLTTGHHWSFGYNRSATISNPYFTRMHIAHCKSILLDAWYVWNWEQALEQVWDQSSVLVHVCDFVSTHLSLWTFFCQRWLSTHK